MRPLTCFVLILAFSSCDKLAERNPSCLQRKYLGDYCEGAVIQLPFGQPIGRSWKSPFAEQRYQNCLIASFDSTVFKGMSTTLLTAQRDSTFYFQYKEGGYPSRQYSICEPSAFVTITAVSSTPCGSN